MWRVEDVEGVEGFRGKGLGSNLSYFKDNAGAEVWRASIGHDWDLP